MACAGQVFISIAKSICDWALASAQSIVVFIQANSSEASSDHFCRLQCRLDVDAASLRLRTVCERAVEHVGELQLLVDWRSRPEAKRPAAAPIMPI